MSALGFFKWDADLVHRVAVIAAFTIVMLVTLGLGRPAHAAMSDAMTCTEALSPSLR